MSSKQETVSGLCGFEPHYLFQIFLEKWLEYVIFVYMKYSKEELDNLINVEKLSYLKIGKLYNVSDTYIKRIALILGVRLPMRNKKNSEAAQKRKSITNCLFCKKEMPSYVTGMGHKQLYCGDECRREQTLINNKIKTKARYEEYLKNDLNYDEQSVKKFKKFMLEDQENRCAICSIENMWGDKVLVFVQDHIDGNANNNARSNLRLVCPNCDSQLDTFKSKNKNSARKERYILNKK